MKTKDLVPEVYYRESRDFSFIGRLFEIVFNYMKTNADLSGVSVRTKNTSSSMIELLSTTLGFESVHSYPTQDLNSLCSVFSYLLRNKGNKTSIESAITLLMNTQEIKDTFSIDVDSEDSHHFYIYVPSQLNDTVLLEDIFEYILPVGTTFTFRTIYGDSSDFIDEIEVSDSVTVHKTMKDYQLGQVGGKTGINTVNTLEDEYGDDVDRSMIYTSTVVGDDKSKE